MANATYLMIANIAVWAGIAGYVAFLHIGSARIDKRLAVLERVREDEDA